MPKITKRAVDALIPDPNRDLQVMDTELIGFGVRMKPSGAAAYFVRYRTPDGGSRRLVIGKVGTLTPRLFSSGGMRGALSQYESERRFVV